MNSSDFRLLLEPYQLTGTETAILDELCNICDRIDWLESKLAESPEVMVRSANGQGMVVNPLVPEIRHQRAEKMRLVKALNIPEYGFDDKQQRSQAGRDLVNARWRNKKSAGET